MNSLSTTIADWLPYVFAAIGLEVLSSRIRGLKDRVDELEGKIKKLKVDEPSSPLPPHFDAVKRQKERTRQFLAEREQREQGSRESGAATR
ncbi:hypothetical protein [Acidipila rosea]|uniref:Uncharacterized protein n=1 Tax=Acidipila rosea TaxID=768535 RepID=A0A4V6NEW2_9BACT|nr:hypothetical protein [Acidipila rosea]TCK75991.1 hypothetical protein C7378_0995 [Acidipila rosea]